MKHAKLSASGSKRWLACAASIQAEAQYENTNNIHSVEGSMAHELADICCKRNIDAREMLGKKAPKKFLNDKRNKRFFNPKKMKKEGLKALPKRYPKDMCDHVQEYLNYVRSFVTKGSILMPEQRVNYSNYIKDGFGTSDNILIIPKAKTVHIFDLKYGKGVQVFAPENSQGMLYGVGTLNEYSDKYKIKKVVIHIIQPRLNHYDRWQIKTADLLHWAEYARKRSLKTAKPNPKFKAGDHCTFCLHRDNCIALAQFTEDAIKAKFNEVKKKGEDALPPIQSLSKKQKSKIIQSRKIIEKFMNSVYDESVVQAEVGMKFPDLKLVRGRSNRYYKNPKKAKKELVKQLGKKAFKPKELIGITAAEKELGKREFADLDITKKPLGKLTLVHKDDPKPEVKVRGFDL